MVAGYYCLFLVALQELDTSWSSRLQSQLVMAASKTPCKLVDG